MNIFFQVAGGGSAVQTIPLTTWSQLLREAHARGWESEGTRPLRWSGGVAEPTPDLLPHPHGYFRSNVRLSEQDTAAIAAALRQSENRFVSAQARMFEHGALDLV